MSDLSDRLLAMVQSGSHKQQDYLEVIEQVLGRRLVDYDDHPP